MKYKALVLSLLLLAPFAFAAIATADFPPPPPPPGYQPVLWVDMGGVWQGPQPWLNVKKFWGPCIVSTNFNVDVRLWNDIDITANDVYAFDFTLAWNELDNVGYPNDPYISVKSITKHLPTGWVLVFETTLAQAKATGVYRLAATDVFPGTGLTKAMNISLVTLTFHIDDEPCYPNHFETLFDLTNLGMSGDGTEPKVLNPEVDDGLYWIGSKMPDIHLTSPDQKLDAQTGLYYVEENALGIVHKIKVLLSNITHAYGFHVRVAFSDLYKEADLQKITIGPDWILANYAYEEIEVGAGYVDVTLIRPKPEVKPLICSVLSEAFAFDLTVISPDVGFIPTPVNTTISITEAWILALPVEVSVPYEYNYNFVGPTPLEPNAYSWPDYIYYSCDMINIWKPKRPDITLDGHVDIKDLTALIDEYDNVHPWGDLAAVGTPGTVDIFDVVYIAKLFGDC